MNRKQKAFSWLVAIIALSVFGASYGAKRRLGDVVWIRSNNLINSCDSFIHPVTFATTGNFITIKYATLEAYALCPIRHSIYVGE
jgi:hypothetical protein